MDGRPRDHALITIFACPKAFEGHSAVIQRNAITSWTLLEPRPEIILFCDDAGTAETCQDLGLHHVPRVARNEFGTPLLGDMFAQAHQLAQTDLLCYINADILMMNDFVSAAGQVARWRDRFLMVGRRWDLDIVAPLDYQGDWSQRLRDLSARRGKKQTGYWIDYFLFPRGLFPTIPPFAVGRPHWDNWLIASTLRAGIPVVDATAHVRAVHQNHDYSHLRGGWEENQRGIEAQSNHSLAEGLNGSIADASHILTRHGVHSALPERMWRAVYGVGSYRAGPLRHRLGLRRGNLAQLWRSLIRRS